MSGTRLMCMIRARPLVAPVPVAATSTTPLDDAPEGGLNDVAPHTTTSLR